MIRTFSSIRLTFIALLALISLMAAGIAMGRSFADAFSALNETEFLHWLLQSHDTPLPVKVWFLTLCFASALLLANAFCCCLIRLPVPAWKGSTTRTWLFLILHGLFILVLSGHGLILATGTKQSGTLLFPGQDTDFLEYQVRVIEVIFKDDTQILQLDGKKQRALLTRDNIRLKNNTAVITLSRDGKILKTRPVQMLSPLRHGPVQVTIREFVFQDGQTGVNLILTRNAMIPFFFLAYGAMIPALACYTLMYWRKPNPQ